MLFRGVSAVMILLFGAAMLVQYNDPDGITWMGIYGLAALLTALAMAGHNSVVAPIAGIGYIVGALIIMPKHGGNWRYIEQGRESMGLLLCAAWMGVVTVHWWRRRGPRAAKTPEP